MNTRGLLCRIFRAPGSTNGTNLRREHKGVISKAESDWNYGCRRERTGERPRRIIGTSWGNRKGCTQFSLITRWTNKGYVYPCNADTRSLRAYSPRGKCCLYHIFHITTSYIFLQRSTVIPCSLRVVRRIIRNHRVINRSTCAYRRNILAGYSEETWKRMNGINRRENIHSHAQDHLIARDSFFVTPILFTESNDKGRNSTLLVTQCTKITPDRNVSHGTRIYHMKRETRINLLRALQYTKMFTLLY